MDLEGLETAALEYLVHGSYGCFSSTKGRAPNPCRTGADSRTWLSQQSRLHTQTCTFHVGREHGNSGTGVINSKL